MPGHVRHRPVCHGCTRTQTLARTAVGSSCLRNSATPRNPIAFARARESPAQRPKYRCALAIPAPGQDDHCCRSDARTTMRPVSRLWVADPIRSGQPLIRTCIGRLFLPATDERNSSGNFSVWLEFGLGASLRDCARAVFNRIMRDRRAAG